MRIDPQMSIPMNLMTLILSLLVEKSVKMIMKRVKKVKRVNTTLSLSMRKSVKMRLKRVTRLKRVEMM